MKRISIISSYAWIKVANNYGALLQCYALQQYLIKKGHYAFWIKFVLYDDLKSFSFTSRFVKFPLTYFNTFKMSYVLYEVRPCGRKCFVYQRGGCFG